MRNRILSILLVAVFLSGFAFWFTSYFEYRSETVHTGLQAEARSNPYLAMERLFERAGLTVNKKGNLLEEESLPPTGATLFLPGERYEMSPREANRLLQWVRDGGRLIVKARYAMRQETNNNDPLLSPMGLRIHHDTKRTRLRDEERETYSISLNDGENAQLELNPAIWFEFDEQYPIGWSVRDKQQRALALELGIGEGRLVVLNELAFLSNRRINQHDHAYIALGIFNAAKGAAVWIADSVRMPSLLQLLRQHAWPPLLVLFALIIVYLLHAGARLGPLELPPGTHRRSLMEHIRATGRFLWRHAYAEALVQSARQAVYARLKTSQPFWLNLPEPDLWNHLAEISEQSTDDVRFAFNTDNYNKQAEFTRAMRILQTIGNSL